MTGAKGHGARVVVPPPLLFLAGFLAGIGLGRVVPGDALPPAIVAPARVAGIALATAGVLFAFWGIATFRRRKTTILPHRPVSALVAEGPYRVTRNPMYVGFTLLYLGGTALVNSAWPLAFLPVILFVMNAVVIPGEERHLAARFGEPYREYCRRVRRWL